MGIQNVYAAPEAAPKKPEIFEGYEVKDGKLQRGYTDIGYYMPFYTSTIQAAQARYDYNKMNEQKNTKPKDDYSWNPFVWVGKVFSNVFTFISDMFKNIFRICGFCEDKAPEAKPEGEKEEPTRADNK